MAEHRVKSTDLTRSAHLRKHSLDGKRVKSDLDIPVHEIIRENDVFETPHRTAKTSNDSRPSSSHSSFPAHQPLMRHRSNSSSKQTRFDAAGAPGSSRLPPHSVGDDVTRSRPASWAAGGELHAATQISSQSSSSSLKSAARAASEASARVVQTADDLIIEIDTKTSELQSSWRSFSKTADKLDKGRTSRANGTIDPVDMVKALERATDTVKIMANMLAGTLDKQGEVDKSVQSALNKCMEAMAEINRINEKLNSVYQMASVMNRSIKKQPPSKREWNLIGYLPDLLPPAELLPADQEKYGYHNALLETSILPDDARIAALTDDGDNRYFSTIDNEDIAEFTGSLIGTPVRRQYI